MKITMEIIKKLSRDLHKERHEVHFLCKSIQVLCVCVFRNKRKPKHATSAHLPPPAWVFKFTTWSSFFNVSFLNVNYKIAENYFS